MNIVDFFYTQAQVAQMLGVTNVTIWRWIKEGRFDVQRVGREVLIPKWEVDMLQLRRQKRRERKIIKVLK